MINIIMIDYLVFLLFIIVIYQIIIDQNQPEPYNNIPFTNSNPICQLDQIEPNKPDESIAKPSTGPNSIDHYYISFGPGNSTHSCNQVNLSGAIFDIDLRDQSFPNTIFTIRANDYIRITNAMFDLGEHIQVYTDTGFLIGDIRHGSYDSTIDNNHDIQNNYTITILHKIPGNYTYVFKLGSINMHDRLMNTGFQITVS